jgi:hypothetical protein
MLTPMTVDQFRTACSNTRVYYDKAFQRRFGAWTRKQENRFLLKLFTNKAHTLIVLANVAACLEHSRARGQVNSVRAYEKILERAYTYISLDGQHRTKTILKFFNNELTITGTFTDCRGEVHELDNVYYKDLPAVLQSQFLSAPVTLSVEVDSLYEDLSQHFRDLNSGSATNEQEDRNSYPSPIADQIRTWRDRWRDPLSRVVKADDVVRMGDDELLVKLVMALLRSYNGSRFAPQPDLTKGTLDNFYKIGLQASSITSRTSPYVKAELNRAEDILEMAMNALEKQTYYKPSQMIASRTAWAIIFACAWAYDSDFVITDYEKFFKAVKKNDEDLINEGEANFIMDKQAKIKKGEDPDDIKRLAYYFAWPGLPHQKGPRAKRNNALCARLETVVTNNDLESLALAEAKDLAA